MKLKRYKEQLETSPRSGHHIMAQYDESKMIVYRSNRPAKEDRDILVTAERAPLIPENQESQGHLQLSNAKLVQNG